MKKEILRMQDIYMGEDRDAYSLEDFHVYLCEGEMVDIISLSNAKESLLYEYFTGRIPLKKGKVIYNKEINKEGEFFSATTDVVCIGQSSTLIPGLSVAENIFVITGRRKGSRIVRMKNIYYRAKTFLAQYAPGLNPHTPARDLSPVEKRIVELLRAFESEAKLVVIDNIFNEYGRNDSLRIQELLRLLKEKGTAVLYISHRMDFNRELAERTVVLRRGRNVRTFFGSYYDDEFCLKLLTGNGKLSAPGRPAVSTDKVVFEIQELSGGQRVHNLNLKFHEGEIVGLYDVNNQKNLELVKIMIGEIPVEKGSMYLNSMLYVPRNLEYLIKNNVGYVSSDMSERSLVGTMNFVDNLSLPIWKKASYMGIFRSKKMEDFLGKEYIESLGIPLQEKDTKVRDFDVYIQISILLLRWILFRPALMICEEPFSSADMVIREIMFKAFALLTQNGCTVLLASQYRYELQTICDTLYALGSNKNEEIKEYDLRTT